MDAEPSPGELPQPSKRGPPLPLMAGCVFVLVGLAVAAVFIADYATRLMQDGLRANTSMELSFVDDCLRDYVKASGRTPADAADACRSLTETFTGKDGKTHGPIWKPDPNDRVRPAGVPPVLTDVWGRPLVLEPAPAGSKPQGLRFRSLGPNGVDDKGAADDVVAR